MKRSELAARFNRGLVDSTLTTCTRWCEKRVVMPNPHAGPMKFDRFPWQKEILNINEGEVTVQKAAQIGFSIAGLVRALYVVGELANDVMYILPTQGLAGDFSKARFDAVLGLSPEVRDLFRKINSVGLKITERLANLYIRGSVSQSGLVSVPISSAVIDEFDRCKEGTLDLVRERLSGQLTKYLFNLSTPTLPEFGINAAFRDGSQEEFFFQCPSCGRPENLKWPDNIIIRGEHHNDPDCDLSEYICTHCKSVLPHDNKMEWLSTAYWVPKLQVPGHRSFHINQMYSTTVSPGEMARASFKAELSELAAIEFKNQKLGLAHIGEGARITDSIIDECIDKSYRLGEDRPEDSNRLICMGIDVGSFLDCWIAEYIYEREPGTEPYGNSRSRLLQAIRLPGEDYEGLGNLMREWQVHHACIDFQPDTVNARAFCRRFPGYASMVQYRRGTVGNEIKEQKDENFVSCLTVDRTVFMDMALGRFHKGKISVPANTLMVVREHLKSPMRTYEIDEMGLPRAVYKSVNDDHFAHASAYCEIAHFQAYTSGTGRTIKPGESF